MGEGDDVGTDTITDADYALFVKKLRVVAGIDLAGYKQDQMRRRLMALATRHGATTLAAFADVMGRDRAALESFKNFFTINVSEFVRDPSRWKDLAGSIIPALLAENGGRPLKVWSAGCSYGAEPYSLAMVLEEIGPGQGHTIVGTDIDDTILAKARAGRGYTDADLRGVEPARRAKFFTKEPDGTYTVSDGLKARVTFRRQDLLREVPGQGFDLVVCRNVVIYFTDDAKKALYERIHGALRPGGVLFVGGTEIVAGAREMGLDPASTSFYRKAGPRVARAA